MRLKDIPNIISAIRLIAVIPLVWLLFANEIGWGLALFAAAGISDGIDGFLAKHYGWQSRLGGILDPLADKALLIGSFLALGSMGLIPLWLVVAVVLRDLVIVAGALVYHYWVEEVEASPTLTSKLNTLIQLVLVVAVLTNAGLFALPGSLIPGLTWICLVTVTASGVEYVWVWTSRARMRGWRNRSKADPRSDRHGAG